VLGGAAFVGLAAQVAVPLPFTPVPVTGQTFAVLLVGAAFGPLRAVLSMAIYLVAGVIGLPWFAESSTAYTEGTLTPTFGYIVGFIAAAALVVRFAPRAARAPGLWALGTSAILVLYAWPFVRGYGRNPTVASLLDRNYATGLLAALGLVWLAALLWGLISLGRSRRSDRVPQEG